ncbi:MAG TPA: hypothetical protein VLJ37_05620 [bacterium]|nr:hypothetical protein [bacterium]
MFLLVARTLWACPVCYVAGSPASRSAYLQITVFLLVLPLLLSAGFFWWYRSRARRAGGRG